MQNRTRKTRRKINFNIYIFPTITLSVRLMREKGSMLFVGRPQTLSKRRELEALIWITIHFFIHRLTQFFTSSDSTCSIDFWHIFNGTFVVYLDWMTISSLILLHSFWPWHSGRCASRFAVQMSKASSDRVQFQRLESSSTSNQSSAYDLVQSMQVSNLRLHLI